MSFFDDAEDRLFELYRGWTGTPAHPHSPAGGAGPGRSRQPGPQGMSATPFSTSLPHPDSRAGRSLTHSDIVKALEKTNTKGKGTFGTHSLKRVTGRFIATDEGRKIADVARTWIRTPYREVGGKSKKGEFADCSGSTHAIYEEAGFTYAYQATKGFADYAEKSNRFKPAPGNIPQIGDVGYWRNASRGHMVIYDPKANEYLTDEQLQKRGKFSKANTWSATG